MHQKVTGVTFGLAEQFYVIYVRKKNNNKKQKKIPVKMLNKRTVLLQSEHIDSMFIYVSK